MEEKFDKLEKPIKQAIKEMYYEVPKLADRYSDIMNIKEELEGELIRRIFARFQNDDSNDSLFEIYETLRGRSDITIDTKNKGLRHSSGLLLKADMDSVAFIRVFLATHGDPHVYYISTTLKIIVQFCEAFSNITSLYGDLSTFIQKQVDNIYLEICKARRLNQIAVANNVVQFDRIGSDINDAIKDDIFVLCKSTYSSQDNNLVLKFDRYSTLTLNLPNKFKIDGDMSQQVDSFRKDLLSVGRKYLKMLNKYATLYEEDK